MQQKKAKPSRYISRAEMLDRVGVSYPTIWEWMRRGTFPISREVDGGACWLEHEIDQWIRTRPKRQYKPLDAAPMKKARG